MLLIAISTLLLLVPSVPAQTSPAGPKNEPTTTEISTTSETNTTTELSTTTEISTTTTMKPPAPVEDCCDNFTMEPGSSPAGPLLPTDIVILKASCTCKTKIGLSCPTIKIAEEAQGKITLSPNYVLTNQSCNLTAVLTAVQSQFTRRSIEVPLILLGFNTTRQIKFRFEKSSDKGKCNEDFDCWYSREQICTNNMCSCYSDKPSFVVEEEKCYTASVYGKKCLYDEQCKYKDVNSVCVEKQCACRKNYWVKSDKDPVCITSLSAKLIPSQFLILGVVVSSIIHFGFLK